MKWTYVWVVLACILAVPAAAQEYSCPEELFPAQDPKTKLYGYRNIMREWRIPATFQGATVFDGVNAVVMQNTRMGVIDCKGYFVLQPRYENIMEYTYSRGWAKLNGKWGLLDNSGHELQGHIYDEVRPVAPRKPLTWVRQDQLWGVFHKDQNRTVIPPTYEAYSQLSDTAALVRRKGNYRIVDFLTGKILQDSLDYVVKEDNGLVAFVRRNRWGVADKFGRLVVPARYDSTYSRGALAVARQDGKLGAFARGKAVVPFVYDEIGAVGEGLIPVRKGNQWQYVSAGTGNAASPATYRWAGPFRSGYAVTQTARGYGLLSSNGLGWALPDTNALITQVGGRYYAVYTRKGRALCLLSPQLLPVKAPAIDSVWTSDPVTATRVRTLGKVRLMNVNTLTLLPNPGFDYIGSPLANGLYPVRSGSRMGLADITGKVVVNPAYDSVTLVNYGGQDFYRLYNGGKQGIANGRGQVLIAPAYDQVLPAPPNHVLVQSGGRWGIASQNGKETVPATYAQVQLPKPGVPAFPWAVQNEKGRWGAIDANGQTVLPFDYEQLQSLGQGFYLAKRKDKGYLMRQEGQPIGSEAPTAAGTFAENLVPVKIGNAWGYLNTAGKLAIPATYEQALAFKNGTAPVLVNGKWGLIDRTGQYTVSPRFRQIVIEEDGTRRLLW